MTHDQEARELAKAMVDEMIALHDYAGRPAWDAIAERYLSEALRQRDEARAALVYKGDYDTDDEHTEAILAAHPIKSGDWSHWNAALEMVSNRKSKGSLVMLVNWLLKRPTWLPIDTVTPDVGDEVLIAHSKAKWIRLATFLPDKSQEGPGWCDHTGYFTPTHWMPLVKEIEQ